MKINLVFFLFLKKLSWCIAHLQKLPFSECPELLVATLVTMVWGPECELFFFLWFWGREEGSQPGAKRPCLCLELNIGQWLPGVLGTGLFPRMKGQ